MRYQRKGRRTPAFNARAVKRLHWLAHVLQRATVKGRSGLEFDPEQELPRLGAQLRAIAAGGNARVELGLTPGSGRAGARVTDERQQHFLRLCAAGQSKRKAAAASVAKFPGISAATLLRRMRGPL